MNIFNVRIYRANNNPIFFWEQFISLSDLQNILYVNITHPDGGDSVNFIAKDHKNFISLSDNYEYDCF